MTERAAAELFPQASRRTAAATETMLDRLLAPASLLARVERRHACWKPCAIPAWAAASACVPS